jgi:spore coat protein A, manganese oxidase
VVRWAPLDVPVHGARAGVNLYPFDPTVGPGYVWHCHILDHEDNDMMRPYSPTW